MLIRSLLMLLFFTLTGCGLNESEKAVALQVGTNQWPGYEPLYLAKSKGFYPENLRVVLLPSASEVMRALRNEVIDVAGLTLDEALILASSGVDLKIFLVADISAGADVILARPELNSVAELKGRRVGVESTALGAFMLSRALQLSGLQASDVELVDLQVDQHEEAYLTDKVDAVVTFEPVRTRLLKAGARPIFDSRQLPEEIVDVLVIRTSVIETQRENLKALIDGWFKARDLLVENNHSAMVLAAKHQGISAAELSEALTGIELPARGKVSYLINEAELVNRAVPIQRWMQQKKLLKGEQIDLHDLLLQGLY